MSNGIPVRDELLAGIAFNLAGGRQMMQQQQYPRMEEAPHNQYQMYGPVASLQQSLNEAFRVHPDFLKQSELSPDEETTITLTEDVEADLLEMTLAQRKKILSEHFSQRLDQRENTSRRLQAITGMYNDTIFAPDVENPDGQGSSERLRLFLRSACRENGYRKLELDLCGFFCISVDHDIRGEPLGSVPPEPDVDGADNPCLRSEGGSLTLFEADARDRSGRTTTWQWWKFCKPLGSFEPDDRHHLAPDVAEEEEATAEGEAWIIMAIPKSQIEVLEESWMKDATPGSRTNGDYLLSCAIPWKMRSEDKAITQRRKGVAYRYSRDGFPALATSKKTGDINDVWSGFRDTRLTA
ncbi:hypothetical protein A9Z42_0052580 [Trichoderma parareesei]|uniref:Uncharacterized protein n=1 Tax=Trichoderma parareesei TaxID=858221 RepID=A0A2H2ZRH6_TRIPA|nr:hypothetical protein A9Z42_0052580 [Trichoderma parareesei]